MTAQLTLDLDTATPTTHAKAVPEKTTAKGCAACSCTCQGKLCKCICPPTEPDHTPAPPRKRSYSHGPKPGKGMPPTYG